MYMRYSVQKTICFVVDSILDCFKQLCMNTKICSFVNSSIKCWMCTPRLDMYWYAQYSFEINLFLFVFTYFIFLSPKSMLLRINMWSELISVSLMIEIFMTFYIPSEHVYILSMNDPPFGPCLEIIGFSRSSRCQ